MWLIWTVFLGLQQYCHGCCTLPCVWFSLIFFRSEAEAMKDLSKGIPQKWRLFFKLFCYLSPQNIPQDSIESTFMFEQVSFKGSWSVSRGTGQFQGEQVSFKGNRSVSRGTGQFQGEQVSFRGTGQFQGNWSVSRGTGVCRYKYRNQKCIGERSCVSPLLWSYKSFTHILHSYA